MLQIFIPTVIIVAIAFLAIGINIIFFRRPFPETEISRNKKMRELGIYCAKCEEIRRARIAKNAKLKFKNVSLDISRLPSQK